MAGGDEGGRLKPAPATEAAATTRGADRVIGARTALAGVVVATVAFWAYAATLLPGVDLGDTAGFQAAVIWSDTIARDSYPLYYTLAAPFVDLVSASNPARGLNLFSALWAAVAVGVLVAVSGRLTRSVLAGSAAGLLLAFSPTFWSQAVIAEVYTLHLALVGGCLLALQRFADRPTMGRLALFFAIYAIGFGNHLSMILLLVPCAVFLWSVHPTPPALLRPTTIALALGIAASGALVYSRNLLAVSTAVDASPIWAERLATFWFDVTKVDWRGSMVLGVESTRLSDQLGMWWWDARQQFGAPGLALAAAGLSRLLWTARPWGALVLSAYAIQTLFALTYNVGDAHVFFLPSHLFTAFAAGFALAPARREGWARSRWALVLPVAALAYGGWRGWDTWPVADRHDDRRAAELVARLTHDLHDRDELLVTELDWQVENAVLYASRHDRRDLAWTRLPDVLSHLPFLVADNHAIGRDVVLTARAAGGVLAAYGPAWPLVADAALPGESLRSVVEGLPRGTPYVLTLLSPLPQDGFDAAEFTTVLRTLTANDAANPPAEAYAVWAGLAGERGGYQRASNRPFRETFPLLGDPFTVRMESWLPSDTFRRAGFGRILRGREPILALERGVSLMWLRRDGSPGRAYAAGLYAPEPRFRIPATTDTLVRQTPERPRPGHATPDSRAHLRPAALADGGAGEANP